MKKRLLTTWTKVKQLLRAGLSPQKVGWSIALGVVVGIIPMLGVASLILAPLGLYFRLNLPLIFVATYLVTPLQWILFIPFIHLGELLFQVEKSLLSMDALMNAYEISLWNLMEQFFWEITYGLSAWLLIAFPLAVVIAYASRQVLKFRQNTSVDA